MLTYTVIRDAIEQLRVMSVSDMPSDLGRLECPVCKRSLQTDDGPALSDYTLTYADYEKLRSITVAQLVALNAKVAGANTLTFGSAVQDCWLEPTWNRAEKQFTLMLWVDGILTGIEPDGYTHT